jgi:hypothetical protein
MSVIGISRSGRNTPANTVHLFGVRVHFSYDTPVACRAPGKPSFRRKNVWGPTTGRHLSEWGFGGDWVEHLDEEEFNRRLDQTIFEAIANHMAERLGAAV